MITVKSILPDATGEKVTVQVMEHTGIFGAHIIGELRFTRDARYYVSTRTSHVLFELEDVDSIYVDEKKVCVSVSL